MSPLSLRLPEANPPSPGSTLCDPEEPAVSQNTQCTTEMWVFIASLLSNAVVGFLIAYFQAIDANSPARAYVGWTTILFGILFVLAIMVAFRKRLSLREKGRDIELRTVSAQVRSS
jgi:Na+(H+)/acetate symporter ActP